MDKTDKLSLLKSILCWNNPEQKNNDLNTWEWVRAQRKLLATDTDNYPYRADVEELWKHMEQFYQYDGGNLVPREDDERVAETPLGAFLYYDEAGFYPPPEVLTAIADAFNVYMAAGGELSLEDVFFGPIKKGVGNYSAKLSKYNIYKSFHYRVIFEKMSVERNKKDNKSMEELAEEYHQEKARQCYDFDQEEYTMPDIDSFLRGYRRWKKSQPDK